MRSYEMRITVDCQENELTSLREHLSEILTTAGDISFTKLGGGLQAQFDNDLVGGETEDEFFIECAKAVWSKLRRFVPISCQAIDMDSQVWDGYNEDDDEADAAREYCEDAASVYLDLTATHYENIMGKEVH